MPNSLSRGAFGMLAVWDGEATVAGESTFNDRVADIVELFRTDPIDGWAEAGEVADEVPGPVRWPECARLLRSGDAAERAAGVALLQGSEIRLPTWVRQLQVAALNDPDDDVVALALRSASLRETPEAVTGLSRIARCSSSPVNRLHAAESLADAPGLSHRALVALVSDPEVEVRRLAVRALALGVDASSDEVVTALGRARQDPDEQVKGDALAGLAARRAEGSSEFIAAQIDSDQVGPWLLQAAEYAADPALLPALGRFSQRRPDVPDHHGEQWLAAMAACAGSAWTMRPRAPRQDGSTVEPLASEERVALQGRTSRSAGSGSTCVWLSDEDISHLWLVDLATLRWQRFKTRDGEPRRPVAGRAIRTRWGGMVAVYRIGEQHRMIVGRQRFDLNRPGTFEHACHSLLSTITAAQDGKESRARRFEAIFLPEAIGLGDPMLTYRQPFGGWYPLHSIARLANDPSDYTAGPYDYRHDYQEIIVR